MVLQNRTRRSSRLSSDSYGTGQRTSLRSNRRTRYAARDPHQSQRLNDKSTAYSRSSSIVGIDGLRALAIISIIVYHANVTWLPGGFIGVPVFFAISGFLITRSILKEFDETGTLAYGSFLLRRLNKLWPQLLCLVGFTLLLSAICAPTILSKAQQDALPALFFFENWWFIVREVSYFAQAGSPSPLTHLWFLALIMQFYLIWPLILLVLRKLGLKRRGLSFILGIAILASTLAMIILYDPRADTARIYYGLDTRAAELLLGALAAVIIWDEPSTRKTRGTRRSNIPTNTTTNSIFNSIPVPPDIVGLIAIAALIAGAVFLNGYSAFSYRGGLQLMALMAVILILVISDDNNLLSRIFAFTPLAAIGKRGFALYLWHYPLLTIMNPVGRIATMSILDWVLEFVLIVFVAELSYQLFERNLLHNILSGVGEGRLPFTLTPKIVLDSLAVIFIIVTLFLPTQEATNTGGIEDTVVENGGAGSIVDKARSPEEETHQAMYDAANTIFDGTSFGKLFQEINVFAIKPNENGVTQANVLLIGDSVPGACEEQFAYYFPNGHLDWKVGRQLYYGDDVYEECVAYGYGGDYVVYSLGDNGLALEEDVKTLIEVAGDRPVYLVTARVPEYIQDLNNELFKKIASEYDNVEIIDWYAESEGHSEWFWDDMTHLRPEGAEAYTLMIRRAICGA